MIQMTSTLVADADIGLNYLAAFKSDFPSLCTIQNLVQTQNPDGSEVLGSPANVPGLVNIPCRVMDAYQTGTRSASEETRQAMTVDRVLYQVDLAGYFPQITAAMIAIIDGVQYNIVGRVDDGSKLASTLRAEIKSQ